MSIKLTPAADMRSFTVNSQTIVGLGGNDTITVKGRSNTVDGDAGNDTLTSTGNNNTLIGDLGLDTLDGTATAIKPFNTDGAASANQTLNGGADNDLIDADVTAESFYGNATATEKLIGGAGNDRMDGYAEAHVNTEGGDGYTIRATNTMQGDGGDDRMIGYAKAGDGREGIVKAENIIDGGTGNDTVTVEAHANTDDYDLDIGRADAVNIVKGADGADTVTASATASNQRGDAYATNKLDGGNHNDSLTATAEAYAVDGDAIAYNELNGKAGNDTLFAEIFGDSSNGFSRLSGGSGNDELTTKGGGGDGDRNILNGGTGSDFLFGGDADDDFSFHVDFGADDIVRDAGGQDKLWFGSGITPSNLQMSSSGDDLILKLGNDKVTIDGHFGSGHVEVAEFSDGQTFNLPTDTGDLFWS